MCEASQVRVDAGVLCGDDGVCFVFCVVVGREALLAHMRAAAASIKVKSSLSLLLNDSPSRQTIRLLSERVALALNWILMRLVAACRQREEGGVLLLLRLLLM